MESDRIHAEIFERYYNSVKRAIAANNYELALSDLLMATKTMYERARSSDGALREQHLQQADRLYAQIPELKKKAERQIQQREEAAKKAAVRPQSPPPAKPSNNVRETQEDEDAPLFTAMDVPNTSFEDVKGLHDVKAAVSQKVLEPYKHPELYSRFKMKIGGGVLLYGPPGTGKTMVAKAIAHEVDAKFYALRCSELVSKYFGGTEQNIKLLFETARKDKRAVIFFDEFESLAVSRDKTNSSVMKRVVSELLTQINGILDDNNKDGNFLLLLAATNVPWMIDSAFMRPGRFDERIYVGLPDFDARRGILESAVKDVPCQGLDLDVLAEQIDGYNGADVVQFVEKAKTYPIERQKISHSPEYLTMEDFDEAAKHCRSSVMQSDIKKIRDWENGKRF